MAGEAHDGVVEFLAHTIGREVIMLGRVQVGEIMRNDGARHQACFRLTLPEASATTWRPARDVDDARRLALIKINDWLQAAGLVPDRTQP
ncbi:hypothetical protein BF49_3597 [Bradyrhizobium sp.]|uniref:hypothetical protein n=1 Tax=Bradyrhizobium sp. TaxID=376 RepID=UPI0007C1BA0D|nr:hypothetical protein [Bradyrhizobium sp.]CUT12517.1 hypothetical protein BF49_3597 [Bradyrhizobium sp.]